MFLQTLWTTVPTPYKAYLISLCHTVQAVVVTMVTIGFSMGLCSTPDATLHYLFTNAWAGFLAAALGIGPYVRVLQANKEPQ